MRVQQGAVAPDLEAVWGAVEPRLRASLRAAGVASADLDDLVQEVAVRVLAHEVPFSSADDLLRWCRLVGRRLAVDAHRRALRSTPVDEVPDVAGVVDVEDAALARVRADRVLAALGRLDPSDREAIIDLRTPEADRRAQVRLAVRRHRARARLSAMVDGVAALLGWLALRRRRPSMALAAAAVAPALTGALLLPSVSPADAPPVAAAAPVPVSTTAAPPPSPVPAPAPSEAAAPAGAVDDAGPADEPGDRPRRRPLRKAARRIAGVTQTQVVVQVEPPAALPDLVPATRVEVAGYALELDL